MHVCCKFALVNSSPELHPFHYKSAYTSKFGLDSVYDPFTLQC